MTVIGALILVGVLVIFCMVWVFTNWMLDLYDDRKVRRLRRAEAERILRHQAARAADPYALHRARRRAIDR